MFLYIITGQKAGFWKRYFENMKLVYEIWGLTVKRGLALRNYYTRIYGALVGSALAISHFKIAWLNVPFRYYKSIEGFMARNAVVSVLMAGAIWGILSNFTGIKLWYANHCPDPTNVIYPDYYYPYAIFLVMTGVLVVQLVLVLWSKTVRTVLGKYRYEIVIMNIVTAFVLLTVHCTVAHEGLLFVWWMPESFEMISFSNEEEVVMTYWMGELKYLYNYIVTEPGLLNFKLLKEWAYITLYKVLQI